MNEIDGIMKDLQNLNRLARLIKASETSGYDAEDYLIQETDFTRVRYRPKDRRLWIYSKKKGRDLSYSEYVEGIEYYNNVKVDVQKINDINQNPTPSSDILYEMKAKLIERLYKLGHLKVRHHKDMLVFSYNDKYGFHLPISIALSFVGINEIEERQLLMGYQSGGSKLQFVEKGKVVNMLPEYAEITFSEVEKFYETVMNK